MAYRNVQVVPVPGVRHLDDPGEVAIRAADYERVAEADLVILTDGDYGLIVKDRYSNEGRLVGPLEPCPCWSDRPFGLCHAERP